MPQRYCFNAGFRYDTNVTAIGLTRWTGMVMALVAIVVATSPAAEPERELGRPFLQNFALRDYHAHNQNWAAVQDAEGVLYFGNKNVVLEYDGVAWKKIVVNQTTYVRGLAIEPGTGTIFIGGVDELGYFQGESRGDKEYVSLLDKLPPDARDFRDVRRVFATPHGVFFVADQQVMRWRDGAFKVWKLPNPSRLQSFWAAEQLFVHQPGTGLFRLQDETFVPVSSDPLFQRVVVTFLASGDDGGFIIGTNADGLFNLRDGALTPFPSETDPFLKERKIRRGLRLHDGSLALATESSGLLLLDGQGRLRNRVEEANDLQNDTILDLFQDKEGVLWLCLNSGITRVEVASPLSIYDGANGLKRTTVRDMLRSEGMLYFAAADGIYRLLPADPRQGRPARCERIPGTEGEWWSLCAHEGGLLAAGIEGVFQLGENAAPRKITERMVALSLRCSKIDPQRVFVGTRDGITSIRRYENGAWQNEGIVSGTAGAEVRTVVETARGEVWLGTPIKGIFRIQFANAAPGSRGTAKVSHHYETDGLPQGQHWTRVIEAKNGEALFATQAGVYRFDENSQRFQPDQDFAPRFSDGSFMLGSVAEDADGNLWLAGRSPHGAWPDQELACAFPAGSEKAKQFVTLPYKIADKVGEIEKFYPESETASGRFVWIGGTEGAVRVNVSGLAELEAAPPFSTTIRQATTRTHEPGTEHTHTITNAPVPASQNSVHFEFAATTYTIGANVRYQTRLRGFGDGAWSEFSERASVDYTNLPGGTYTFEVRARDANGRPGTVASLPFRVSPPWHRTYAAYVAYVLLSATALFCLARWQVHRFRRKHAILESLVAARTSELRAREAELLSAKEAADSANRAKSAFLANMSHELRTPLNAILGYTQILLKDDAQSLRNRERLTVVDQSGTHLLAMINEVLDLSKIEAGKLTVNLSEFSLPEMMEDVCAAFRQRVAEKGLKFHCECPDELKRVVRGDAGKLRQILFNLLGNAVKFTEHGSVSLDLTSTDPDQIRFEVKDTGVGIAAEELRDIFLTFHRSSSTASTQGTGLGLAISERLVELLGGKLEVTSTLGAGSRFCFDLKLPAVGTTQAAPSSAAGSTQAPIGFQGAPRRLLIADDAATNRSVLRELLVPLGFEIEEAINGVECLESCMRRLPDALLLDLQMSPIDGFEVTRQLRDRPASRALKIIAVSASVFEDDRQHAINAGCDDFIPKPFTEEQLVTVLGRVLNLEWILAEPPAPVEMSTSDHGNIPPSEEIDAILELSRRGDILGIKKRLTALSAIDNGSYAKFVGQLQPFVAAYQMDRIRDVLLKLKEEATA